MVKQSCDSPRLPLARRGLILFAMIAALGLAGCEDTADIDSPRNGGGSSTDGPSSDQDGDGMSNDNDNCPMTLNPDQADADGDGVGDACDNDLDGDGTDNELDNCPAVFNPDQTDTDGDGMGDACDDDMGMPNPGDDDGDGDSMDDPMTDPDTPPVREIACGTGEAFTPIQDPRAFVRVNRAPGCRPGRCQIIGEPSNVIDTNPDNSLRIVLDPSPVIRTTTLISATQQVFPAGSEVAFIVSRANLDDGTDFERLSDDDREAFRIKLFRSGEGAGASALFTGEDLAVVDIENDDTRQAIVFTSQSEFNGARLGFGNARTQPGGIDIFGACVSTAPVDTQSTAGLSSE